MTKQKIKQLLKKLGPTFSPQLRIADTALCETIEGCVLRGFLLDRTSTKDDIRIYAFGLPLYVPVFIFHFNYAEQVRDGNGRTFIKISDDPGVEAQEKIAALLKVNLHLLNPFGSLNKFRQLLTAYPNQDDPTIVRARFYLSIFLGNGRKAKQLSKALFSWYKRIEADDELANEFAEARSLLAKFEKSPSAAKKTVQEFCQKNIERLGIG